MGKFKEGVQQLIFSVAKNKNGPIIWLTIEKKSNLDELDSTFITEQTQKFTNFCSPEYANKGQVGSENNLSDGIASPIHRSFRFNFKLPF